MEIYHQYVKLRKQFGRFPKFTDEGAEMIADIRPNEEHAKEYLPRNPVVSVTQCVPEMSEHEANTVAVILASKAMSHVEGGWPKDVDYSEAEHTIRYRKKVEKDEDYITTVSNLSSSVEELVKQNNAVDIYQVRDRACKRSAPCRAQRSAAAFGCPLKCCLLQHQLKGCRQLGTLCSWGEGALCRAWMFSAQLLAVHAYQLKSQNCSTSALAGVLHWCDH